MNAQKRETEASLPCVKNVILASTVLLTSGKNYMSASEPLVKRFLDEVVDCLSDRMVSRPQYPLCILNFTTFFKSHFFPIPISL